MQRHSRIAVALLAPALLAALILVLVLGGPSGSSTSQTTAAPAANVSSGFDGAALPASAPAPDFTLRDQDGRSLSLSELHGKVVIVAFLYSTCGATCILIAQQIRGALDELEEATPVLFISADPAADTPANVKRFLEEVSLTGRVLYLTGPLSLLRPIWHAYRITPASAGGAAFDRFASVLLLDAKGRRRVLFEPEQLTPEGLAHDVRKLAGG